MGERSGIDVAVLLMFFCRPEPLQRVFEQVRKARPARLYLHQDGPRTDRPEDVEKIAQCRAVVGEIDWDCEVHRLYRESNAGCGPAQYLAEKWMFDHEESGIILEDDVVPTQSFFLFCRELLELYADDERIDRICGMNNTGSSSHIRDGYLFSELGSMTGWASWKRVLDGWDEGYSWLDDVHAVEQLRGAFDREDDYMLLLKKSRRHRATGLAYHESVGGYAMRSQHRLLIVPTHNLVTYAGVGADASNSPADLRIIPRRTRRVLSLQGREIQFPLQHPKYVIRDRTYENALSGTRLTALLNDLERSVLILRYQGAGALIARIPRLLSRIRRGIRS